MTAQAKARANLEDLLIDIKNHRPFIENSIKGLADYLTKTKAPNEVWLWWRSLSDEATWLMDVKIPALDAERDDAMKVYDSPHEAMAIFSNVYDSEKVKFAKDPMLMVGQIWNILYREGFRIVVSDSFAAKPSSTGKEEDAK